MNNPKGRQLKTHFRSAVQTIILAGLLTGALDIISALTDYYIATGKKPWVVLKFIASGVFDRRAFSGGGNMIFLGFLFHFTIAFLFTIFFFSIYPRIKFLSKSRIVTGILYGAFVWTVMNLVVLPLSNTPPLAYTLAKVTKAMLILIVMIGLPLSFIAHKFFSSLRTNNNISPHTESPNL